MDRLLLFLSNKIMKNKKIGIIGASKHEKESILNSLKNNGDDIEIIDPNMIHDREHLKEVYEKEGSLFDVPPFILRNPDIPIELPRVKPLKHGVYKSIRSSNDPKIGRNQPCPCGSNKKYKHCCYGI